MAIKSKILAYLTNKLVMPTIAAIIGGILVLVLYNAYISPNEVNKEAEPRTIEKPPAISERPINDTPIEDKKGAGEKAEDVDQNSVRMIDKIFKGIPRENFDLNETVRDNDEITPDMNTEVTESDRINRQDNQNQMEDNIELENYPTRYPKKQDRGGSHFRLEEYENKQVPEKWKERIVVE